MLMATTERGRGVSDRGLNGSLRGSALWRVTRRNVSDVAAADPLESHAAQSEHLSQARRALLRCGRTANQFVYIAGGFGSSREKTPTGITYVSGFGQQVLLQRAAHPHEPPLRPDPVGQVAHCDSAAPVAPVAPVGRSTAWLSRLSLSVFSPPFYLRDAVILPPPPPVRR